MCACEINWPLVIDGASAFGTIAAVIVALIMPKLIEDRRQLVVDRSHRDLANIAHRLAVLIFEETLEQGRPYRPPGAEIAACRKALNAIDLQLASVEAIEPIIEIEHMWERAVALSQQETWQNSEASNCLFRTKAAMATLDAMKKPPQPKG